MDKMNTVKRSVILAGVLMTAVATSAQAMSFCGKSKYRSYGYPHHMLGYTPAPGYYGPAYYGYGRSVPYTAYSQPAMQPVQKAAGENKQPVNQKSY